MHRLAALVAVALLAAACGSGGAAADGKARVVVVKMTDFRFSPSTIRVKAGERVTLRFENAGSIEHEFMAGREATPSVGYRLDWLVKAAGGETPDHTHEGESHTGAGVRVGPAWYGSLTLTVPAEKGTFEFGCFVAGHYEAGMKGTLIVD